MSTPELKDARYQLLRIAREIAQARYGDVTVAYERLARAARYLTRVTDALPAHEQPQGWKDHA
jgi:hypothetical protein